MAVLGKSFNSLHAIATVGSSFSDFSSFESALFIDLTNVRSLMTVIREDPPVDPPLLFGITRDMVQKMFEFLGDRMPPSHSCRPANYPGFFPPIGFALAAKAFEEEWESFAELLKGLIRVQSGGYGFFEDHGTNEEPALQAVSLCMAMACIGDGDKIVVETALEGFDLLREFSVRKTITRRMLFWINISFIYSLMEDIWRFDPSYDGERKFLLLCNSYIPRVMRTEARLRRRLKRFIGAPTGVDVGLSELAKLQEVTSLKPRMYAKFIQNMFCIATALQQEILNTCFQVGSAWTKWRKKRAPVEEAGFDHILDAVQTFMASVDATDRLTTVAKICKPKGTLEEISDVLYEFFQKHLHK